MELRLGINTCFAIKRWPRPADWAPIVSERLALRLVQHSFDLIDPLASADVLSREVAEVGHVTAPFELDVASTFTGLAAYSSNLLLDPDPARRRVAMEWYRAAITLTARLGAVATGGHVGAFSVADWRSPQRRSELWQGLRGSLRELASAAAQAGLRCLVVENLASYREPSTIDQFRELVSDGDGEHAPIRLCLDVGHMCVPGTTGGDRDPYAWLRALGDVAPIIQLQQSDEAGDHHWPFTAARNADGRIEADRVLDALGEAGVERTDLVLEIMPPFEQADDDVLDDLVESVDYWREALTRRGVAAP
jgi:sugar phosphate isomerase/epimerase